MAASEKGGIVTKLRYGENAYQQAEFCWGPAARDPLALGHFSTLAGELGMVNMTDMERALTTLTYTHAALTATVIPDTPFQIALAVKHGNCCGAAYHLSKDGALRSMIEGDLDAVMGGCVMVNFPIGVNEAEILLHHPNEKRRIIDVLIAPSISSEAIALLARKEDRCKMIINEALGYLPALPNSGVSMEKRRRQVRGGEIVQDAYRVPQLFTENTFISGNRRRRLEPDLAFAAAICATSNSNTINLVKDGMLLGQGVGQTTRVGAAELAVKIANKRGRRTDGAVSVGDSFFPFDDGVKVLIEAGITALFSTSGALRDQEVRDACVEGNVTLYQLPDKEARMFFGH